MTNHGDDCYFFYYSTCSKGDSCPFRHCEAAMGSEVVCSLWQENRCFRKVCKFRHMEIKKNRTVIPCYWENQPSGCQKPHCAFHHEKSRIIDGVFVPANIGPAVKDGDEEPAQQEPAPPAPNPANPQLRGVMKADTQENVPSPTHPPVVINPVDDEDEDEDDQFSEEGDDRSKMSSPRKLIMGPKDDSLNFNVRTLEEIRLRKALKASLKRAEEAGFTVPGQHSNGSTGEKENMCSTRRPALFTAKNRPEEAGRLRIADRLEKRTLNDGTPVEGELRLKRSLAQRLGGVMDSSEEEPDQSSQRGARLMRERLSLPAESDGTPSPAAPSQPGPPGEIRIKTLEEIRQEKAAKSQAQASGDSSSDPSKKVTNTTATLLTKKQQVLQKRKVREMTHAVNVQQSKEAPEAAPVGKPPAPAQPSGGVRVKTLEEIRREKAARLGVQAQSPPAQDQSSSSGSEDGVAPIKRRILHINKTPSPASSDVKVQKPAELPEKSKDGGEAVANGKSSAPAVEKARPDSASGSGAVKVKTFEEIMREKQLRRQQQEQEAAQSPQGLAPPAAQKRPVTVTTIAAPSSTSTPTPSQPAPVPACQRITVKPKVAPPKPVVAPATTAVRTTEPPTTANASASPKHLPVRLSKRLTITAATVAAPVPTPAPLPVQQTAVSAAAQPEPTASLAKKPKIAAAASAPAPAPTPTPPSLPVQQNPVSSTVQPDPPVSLAKRQKIAAAAAPAPASSAVQQSPVSGTVQLDSPLNLAKKPKTTLSAAPAPAPVPAPAPAPVPLAVQQTPVSGMAQPDTTRETSPLKKSPENKVKPKVNVKPVVKSSSVKPSAHVRPGQKRKAAAGQSSAVAAVKPLSAASAAADEAPELQEPPCKRSEMSTPGPLQAPAISSSALERNTQLNDEPQTVPVFKQSPTTETNSSSAENLMTVPQSPSVLKTPSQTRARKGSTTTPTPRATLASAASSTSAVDDFEELINEFEMDDEVDLEPDKGEDDLLLELSEMIGS